MGAVLYQLNDKQEKEIITQASKTLKGPELIYFTTEKELLAIMWALQKFRTHLHGSETDQPDRSHCAYFLKNL